MGIAVWILVVLVFILISVLGVVAYTLVQVIEAILETFLGDRE